MQSSQPSLTTHIKDWFTQLPFFTRWLTALCIAIYVFGLLFGQNNVSVCTYPPHIVDNFEVYRLLLSGVFHVGLLHLVMNMLAFQGLGTSIERQMGSVCFLYLVLMFQTLSSAVNVFLSWILFELRLYPSLMSQCTVGLSGVLFSLLVLRCNHPRAQTSSVFGLVQVPSHLYPWVLLIVLQLLLPDVSFIGHLSGILVAYAYLHSKWLRLSSSAINAVESSALFGWMVMRDGFIANPHFGLDESLGESVGGASSSSSSSHLASSSPGPLHSFWSRMRGAVSNQQTAASFVPFSGEGRTLASMPPTKAHSPESDAAKCHFVSSSYPNETPLALPLLSASSPALSDIATTTGVKPISPLLAAADHHHHHHAFKGETNVVAHDKVDPEKLSLLVEMGFLRADVVQALNESDGDVNAAVLRLTSNQQ